MGAAEKHMDGWRNFLPATVFGNTATVLVVFEVRVEEDSAMPMGRGLDSISMIRVDGRWWVTSILTDWERPGQTLPAELLPAE